MKREERRGKGGRRGRKGNGEGEERSVSSALPPRGVKRKTG